MTAKVGLLLLVLLVTVSTGCSRSTQPPTSSPANPVGVHLQNGFDGSPVTIRYNGKVIYSGRPVTNPMLDLAEQFDFDRGASMTGTLVLEFKGSSHELHIDWAKGKVVGISITDNQVILRQRDRGFYYY